MSTDQPTAASTVSIVKYQQPLESVRRAVELAGGLDHLPAEARVFIKPNIVFWTKEVAFPKWGVITTSRVVEDMIVLLRERGITDITIGEGIVVNDPKDTATPAHAFETLGYNAMKEKYGIKVVNVFDRPLEALDLGDGVTLNFNSDIINSDFVVNLPVLKTHNQTVVSLGIKNLKGTIDFKSRKICHNADPERGLHFMISKLAEKMPPMLTLIDGIYTLERGPAFDGKVHRSNLLIASKDVLSADLVGAAALGHGAEGAVPYLAQAAAEHGRPADRSDIDIVGEPLDSVTAYHEYDFLYQEDENVCLPVPMAKSGMTGIYYRKYDASMCTYCSGVNGLILTAIRYAWTGEPFDKIEVLTGKTMKPTPGMNKTILVGKCIYQAHKDNPDIKEMIAIKGCPPQPKNILKALQQAGIDANPDLFANVAQLPGFFMNRYQGKPEYDENLFRISPEG